jgi:hypothetical protein
MKRQTELLTIFTLAILAAAIFTLQPVRADVAEAPLTITPVDTLWNNAQVSIIAAQYFDKVAETDARFEHVSLYFRGRASAYAEAYRIMGGTRTL